MKRGFANLEEFHQHLLAREREEFQKKYGSQSPIPSVLASVFGATHEKPASAEARRTPKVHRPKVKNIW